jgi:Zn-dependent membrane protease YugP
MKDNKAAARKTLTAAALVYGAFTAISIVGPILLERLWKRRRP